MNKKDDMIIQKMMRVSVSDYSYEKHLKLFCGTFNVNNRKLREEMNETLNPWILGPIDSSSPTNQRMNINTKPDIFAFSFQEIVDLNTMNVVLDGNKTVVQVSYWKKQLEASLNKIPDKNYKLIASEKLGKCDV